MKIQKQLAFSEHFTTIIEEEITYNIPIEFPKEKSKIIKEIENIPMETIKKIVRKGQSVLRYDSSKGKYYCNMCKKQLTENNYCKSCFKHYDIEESEIINIDVHKDELEKGLICNYFQFQIIDDEVFLYKFVFYSFYDSFNKQEYTIEIGSIFSINKDSIIDLLNDKKYEYKEMIKYLFSELDEHLRQLDEEPSKIDKYYEMLDLYSSKFLLNFVDIGSLDILKNHKLYKYSFIWELKDYLEKNEFDLLTLTLFPIYVKEFEYLVKLKLYSLACKNPMVIKFNKTFQQTFKVSKKYYQFLKEIDITPQLFKVFQMIQITDEKALKNLQEYVEYLESISNKVNLEKALEYIKKENIDYYDYDQYLDLLREFKLDMKDKNNIFPDNFYDRYYKYLKEKEILNNKELVKEIDNSLLLTELNTYEDEKYVIFPASNIDDLFEESKNQRNCVRTYAYNIGKNRSQIYFMREKTNINKSLLTIEVVEGEIVQALGKYNTNPDNELLKILDKWEKTLVPVYNTYNEAESKIE